MAFAILRACRWAESRFYAQPPKAALEPAQIQGLIVDGFDALPHASYAGGFPATARPLAEFLSRHLVDDAARSPAGSHINIGQRWRLARSRCRTDRARHAGVVREASRIRALRPARRQGPQRTAAWSWGGPETPPSTRCCSCSRTRPTSSLYVDACRCAARCGARPVHARRRFLSGKREHFGFRAIAQPCHPLTVARERAGVC